MELKEAVKVLNVMVIGGWTLVLNGTEYFFKNLDGTYKLCTYEDKERNIIFYDDMSISDFILKIKNCPYYYK